MHDDSDIPTNEPFEVVAGDRVRWKRSFTDHKASDSWVLKYYLVHPTNSKITITASADGDDHLVDEAAADTANWSAGKYKWQAFVEKGTDRFRVDHGELEIRPNFADAGVTTFDDRRHAEKVLEAIEAVIEDRASKDQESYTIAGRTLARTPVAELLKFRNEYKAEVRKLRQAERIRNGLDSGNNIRVRFTRP